MPSKAMGRNSRTGSESRCKPATHNTAAMSQGFTFHPTRKKALCRTPSVARTDEDRFAPSGRVVTVRSEAYVHRGRVDRMSTCARLTGSAVEVWPYRHEASTDGDLTVEILTAACLSCYDCGGRDESSVVRDGEQARDRRLSSTVRRRLTTPPIQS